MNASDRAGNTSARTVSYQVAALAASGGAVVSGATESSSRWRAGNALPHESRRRRVPVGTTFKFTLNKTAVVRFDFTQSVPGRKAAGKCVSQNKRNKRKRKCTRSVVRGTFSFTGHAGVNSVRFEGRVSRSKKLKSGKYTLVISAGSNSQKLTFTIVK